MKGTRAVRVFQFNQGVAESWKCGFADKVTWINFEGQNHGGHEHQRLLGYLMYGGMWDTARNVNRLLNRGPGDLNKTFQLSSGCNRALLKGFSQGNDRITLSLF